MSQASGISRRRTLGLGLGIAAALALDPTRLASAEVTGSTQSCDGGFAGYWHGPSNPYGEPNLGTNLLSNPSFEDGPPGATAPGWTFS